MDNNTLSINIPSLNVSGSPLLTTSYDLGGSTQDIATGAYNFLNTQSANDFSFLSGSIAGSQNFLSSQLAPLTKSIQQSQSFNQSYSPFFVNSINSLATQAMNYSAQLNQTSLQVAQNIAISNNQASEAISHQGGGGGMCFITTAICEFENLPDDCDDLMLLREFRDKYMLKHLELKKLVIQYYIEAPEIVKRLKVHQCKEFIYDLMRNLFLNDAIKAVKEKRYNDAIRIYTALFNFAKEAAYEF